MRTGFCCASFAEASVVTAHVVRLGLVWQSEFLVSVDAPMSSFVDGFFARLRMEIVQCKMALNILCQKFT